MGSKYVYTVAALTARSRGRGGLSLAGPRRAHVSGVT